MHSDLASPLLETKQRIKCLERELKLKHSSFDSSMQRLQCKMVAVCNETIYLCPYTPAIQGHRVQGAKNL